MSARQSDSGEPQVPHSRGCNQLSQSGGLRQHIFMTLQLTESRSLKWAPWSNEQQGAGRAVFLLSEERVLLSKESEILPFSALRGCPHFLAWDHIAPSLLLSPYLLL